VADVARDLGVNIDLLEGTEFSRKGNNVLEWNARNQHHRREPLRWLVGPVGIRVTKQMLYHQRGRNNHGQDYNRSNHDGSASQGHFLLQICTPGTGKEILTPARTGKQERRMKLAHSSGSG
jgi:hypothetical protein